MKIFFDTEFIEDGKTIDLISLGAVRDDGQIFYAEFAECDLSRACPWVQEHVIKNLKGGEVIGTRESIAIAFQAFCGQSPEFWAYYAVYDWVAVCQLYGRMIDLPQGWPRYCRYVKQLCNALGNPKLPKQDSVEHNALDDALWVKSAWDFLTKTAPHETNKRPAPWTPGPWRAVAQNHGLFDICGPLGQSLGRFYTWGLDSSGKEAPPRSECQANARLIAAAPEMVAALDAICSAAIRGNTDRIVAAMHQVDAARGKARKGHA